VLLSICIGQFAAFTFALALGVVITGCDSTEKCIKWEWLA